MQLLMLKRQSDIFGVNNSAWTTFKEQFTKKNFLAHVKRQMVVEFQLFKQGDMVVLQYVTKFERLSRYAQNSSILRRKGLSNFQRDSIPLLSKMLPVQSYLPPSKKQSEGLKSLKISTTRLLRMPRGNVSSMGRGPIRSRSPGKSRIPQGKVDVNTVARTILPTFVTESWMDALDVALWST